MSKLVGIENAEKFVSLEGLSDEKVAEIANEYTVFGRVSPEQKAILIKSMKNAKHVVAMTGDGVNDILALKESDCAITVANGSDAAKSVSHLVLMNNNFNSLPHVVLEGRRVINNVQSSASLFLMKTIFTMVINILTLFFYEVYPFVLQNMIFLESCIIGLPAFFLSLQPNETRVEGKFIKKVIQKSVPSAMLMILNVFIISFFGDIVTAQSTYKTIAVIALTFAGLISLFNICRPLNKYRSILFFLIFGVIFLGSIIMIMNPFVSSLFGLTTLFPFYKYTSQLVLLILVLVLDLPITILLKKLFNFLNSKKKQKDN